MPQINPIYYSPIWDQEEAQTAECTKQTCKNGTRTYALPKKNACTARTAVFPLSYDTNAWNEARSAVSTAWSAFWASVAPFFEDLAAALTDMVNALRAIPVVDGLIKAGEKLLSGDFQGALKAFAAGLGLHGEEGHELIDAYPESDPNAYNEYQCRMRQWRWKECTQIPGSAKICGGWQYGEKFPDSACMEAVTRAAARMKIILDRMTKVSARRPPPL